MTMEIKSNTNTTTFKSKIVIVSPPRFGMITDKMYEDPNTVHISNWDILPETFKAPKRNAVKYNVDKGTTRGIRSCTGLWVANGKDLAPVFMHVGNELENLNRLKTIEPYLTGTNAILVGSKNHYAYSKDVFKNLTKLIKKKQIPLSIFRNLKLAWEVSMAGNSKEDTIYLCIKNIENPHDYVRNMKDLKRVFTKVRLSSKDTIEFMTRQKPSFFQKMKNLLKCK